MDPRPSSPELPGSRQRLFIDPASLERPGRRARRRRALLMLLALLLCVMTAVSWWMWRATAPGRTAPVVPSAAPQATPPATVGQAEPSVPVDDAPDGPDGPDAPDTATAAPRPEAHMPPLLSDDTDLSFARRAGLHRADNPLQLTASAVIAVDALTGDTLYTRNADAILPIASLTKLVTAMVLIDSGVPLRQRIEITAEDVDRLRYSRSRLRVGTRLTRGEALRLALMSSENRASHALARTHPVGMDVFVQRMNAKAREIGAVHASFADPTGLSNANRASARDVAAIVAAAAKYPLLRQYSTTTRHVARLGKRPLTYVNSNRLVRVDRWPVALQKTGYIVEAGWCLAMTLRVAGRPVHVVLLDAGSVGQRGQDARKLRRWLARRQPTR